PPPHQCAQRGRHDEREQHGPADQALEPSDAEEQEREGHSEDGLGAKRRRREDDGILKRLEKDRAAEEPLEILETDEYPGLADAGVTQAEPDGEGERIRDEEE